MYSVSNPRSKEVQWDCGLDGGDWPTLAEILEAAQKEFPGVPFEKLEIEASGYDAEFVTLKRKG